MIKTLQQHYHDKLIECTQFVQREYIRCCRPIYGILSDDTAVHIGSSFLILFNNKRYIVTAAHVIDEAQHATLAIAVTNELIILDGDFYHTSKLNGNRDKDLYDFAWKDVTIEMSDLPLENFYILQNDIKFSANLGHAYTLLGYPNSRNKVNHATRQVPVNIFAFSNIGKIEGDHIMIEHDSQNRNSSGKIVNSPKLKGLSGGGVFDLGNLTELSCFTKSPSAKLFGIITSKSEVVSEVRCTKISVIVSAIRDNN